jgi:DNA-binding response OmpR family regulator/ABC-type transporter Mla MlaB component
MNHASQSPVLVVEDDPRSLELITDTLSSAGFEVAISTTGEYALELVNAERPAVILLDLELPGINGFETCRRLKANPATRDIPVLFMTASSDIQDRVNGFSLGAVDYIVKPFRTEELVARTQVHVNIHQLMRRLEAQIEERAAAESALQKLTQELERRVEERTAELTAATAELRRSNDRLENEVAVQTEALRKTNDRLMAELAERLRAEQERARLQEEIIQAQMESLKELSTPVIPITERIMVMPLIGSVSTERARQVVETALLGAHENQAEVVIFDVTGVKRADAAVASMLVSTASALRLVGARMVMTGVRPEMAQLLVNLGVDLGAIVTKGTLMNGIEYGLSIQRSSR